MTATARGPAGPPAPRTSGRRSAARGGAQLLHDLRGELRLAEVLPPAGHARSEVLQQVPQAAGAAAQRVALERPGGRPAHADRLGDDAVELLRRDDAGQDEVHALPEQRRLQPVGDEPADLAVQRDGLLAQGAVERHRGLDLLRGGRGAGDDLDERHDVRRVERVPDQQAARLGHVAGHVARHEPGRRRQDEGVRRHRLLDVGEQRLLELEALGSVLLHDVDALQRLREPGDRDPREELGGIGPPARRRTAPPSPARPARRRRGGRAPAPASRATRTGSPTTPRWCRRRPLLPCVR